MNTDEWRTQLTSDSRSKIIDKIMETLKKHLPYSRPEGLNELRRVAVRFEEKIFSGAVNQTEYLRKISMKLSSMETKNNQATAPSAANYTTPLYQLGYLTYNNNNWRPSSIPNGEPAMDTGDWRTQLPPDSRQKIVNKIMETLKKHLPFSGPEGLNELRRVAVRFEEKIFSGAINQTDYLRKISMKMLTMETNNQATAPPTANDTTSLYQSGYHMVNDNSRPSLPKREPADINTDDLSRPSSLMVNDNSRHSCPKREPDMNTGDFSRSSRPKREPDVNTVDFSRHSLPKQEPDMNTGDWRTQLPPGSRHKNAEKIMETLNKHVPNSGQEGINELMRIAASFEEIIFNTAINQVDYFRKVSFKMQTMEGDN